MNTSDISATTPEDTTAMTPYKEEQRKLTETLEEIARQRADLPPVYYGNDYVEQVLEARREETRQRLSLLDKEPYFGRLDFQEQGKPAPMPLYIGKRGMDYRETSQPYIIDWRAPVASLFYSFTGGEAPVSYDAPDGTIEGEVHLKRNLSIRDRTLERVTDSYVRGGDNIGLSDEFLLYRLGEKKDNRLRDIVSTIQAEQDLIIRAPRYKALIIQGAAGSGKTTVALHRLAFLLYQYQQQIRAERMIIFAPNSMFLDYISGVLPELGVGNVMQTTFADWALDILGDGVKLAPQTEGKTWFTLSERRPALTEETPGRFKGSLSFLEWLKDRLKRYEDNFLRDIPAFEAWEGRVLPVAMIREWFEVEYRHYPLSMRRERLAGRINRWLEMQLTAIGDPKIRKERGQTGKQRLRAYLKKLPEATPIAFYKAAFGDNEDGAIPAKLAKDTLKLLKSGTVMAEDLAPLVWIHYTFNGLENRQFDHVVVDEAQDASPLQIALLSAYMNEPSFTILGDLAQGIHAYRGVQRWEELSDVFAEQYRAYHTLKLSYRSTLEIIEFANRVLARTDTGLPPAEPVFRSGEPVEVERLEDEAAMPGRTVAFIRASQDRGMRTIAVIGRTDEQSARLHEQLASAGVDANLIAEGQAAYLGGITVVPAHLAKGLEFDAVLIAGANDRNYADDPMDAKLLYVACTRALHRLTLLFVGEPSPLIAETE